MGRTTICGAGYIPRTLRIGPTRRIRRSVEGTGSLADAPVLSRAPMRITFVARRAWPAVSGMEIYLRLMSEALPPLERVQVLTATTELHENAFVAAFKREAFGPFTSGQISTEPLRVRGVRSLHGLPVVAQSYAQHWPRGGG